MKIERLNDRQFRCTLNKKDLSDRQLRLEELAYGSEKAKSLFHEMMQRAHAECGFEAENIPIMIEAIPVSPDCLVLLVTKVDNPEELDTRFSKFTSTIPMGDDIDDGADDYEISKDMSPDEPSEADEELEELDDLEDLNEPKESNEPSSKSSLMDCFGQITELIEKVAEQTGKTFVPIGAGIAKPIDAKSNTSAKTDKKTKKAGEGYKLFYFDSMESVITTCAVINPYFNGQSSLYKSNNTSSYHLLVKPKNADDASYGKVCNIISEYAKPERTTYATISFLNEHYTLIIKDDAVKMLSNM